MNIRTATSRPLRSIDPGAARCRTKFLRYFPRGFHDNKYLAWERGYKETVHAQWRMHLGSAALRRLLEEGKFAEIAAHAVRIESRTNLLFSFEKMALRDAVRSPAGARQFADGIYLFLHGPGTLEARFSAWCGVVAGLPRRQTRVLTWPVVTIFGFLAQPEIHFFLKPNVTRRAAEKYGFDFHYESKPSWKVYSGLLDFARVLRTDLSALKPRDMIDLQSFAWVQGSDEYP